MRTVQCAKCGSHAQLRSKACPICSAVFTDHDRASAGWPVSRLILIGGLLVVLGSAGMFENIGRGWHFAVASIGALLGFCIFLTGVFAE